MCRCYVRARAHDAKALLVLRVAAAQALEAEPERRPLGQRRRNPVQHGTPRGDLAAILAGTETDG